MLLADREAADELGVVGWRLAVATGFQVVRGDKEVAIRGFGIGRGIYCAEVAQPETFFDCVDDLSPRLLRKALSVLLQDFPDCVGRIRRFVGSAGGAVLSSWRLAFAREQPVDGRVIAFGEGDQVLVPDVLGVTRIPPTHRFVAHLAGIGDISFDVTGAEVWLPCQHKLGDAVSSLHGQQSTRALDKHNCVVYASMVVLWAKIASRGEIDRCTDS
ncbi:hypothetical protein D3C84_864030 [compost metagenome]